MGIVEYGICKSRNLIENCEIVFKNLHMRIKRSLWTWKIQWLKSPSQELQGIKKGNFGSQDILLIDQEISENLTMTITRSLLVGNL